MLEPTKWNYRYMRVVNEIETWSSCLSRNVGSLITVDNRIVATGYNGAPSGIKSCKERGYCRRKDVPSGQGLEESLAVHAEQNSITQAAKQGIAVNGGTLYCTAHPCNTCAKLIIASGIKEVIYKEDYPNALAKELFSEAGILVWKIDMSKDTYDGCK